MLALYMDESVQGAIVDGLRTRQVDLLTAVEDGRMGADDRAILDRATELKRLLFTQDADLLREGVRCQRAGEPFSGVVYARPSRVPIGVCVRDLELIATLGEAEEFRSSVTYLPL